MNDEKTAELGLLNHIYDTLLSAQERLEEFDIAPAIYNYGVAPDKHLFHAYPLVDAAMEFVLMAIKAREAE